MNEAEYIKRCAKAWGVDIDQSVNLLATEYQQSIRINQFRKKKSTIPTLKKHMVLKAIEWANNCYSYCESSLAPSSLEEFSNGEFTLQNAASFIPVLELQPKPGDLILDMAAAPGGKSSHIANLTKNNSRLILNDTSRVRFFKMKELMAKQGIIAEYSLRDGRHLSKTYGIDYFDNILLDAPCSGQANLGLSAVKPPLSTIKRLQKLQIRLLSEALRLLKPGGVIVYSTCTIAPEENEAVIDYVLRHEPYAKVVPIINRYPIRSTKAVLSWDDKSYDSSVAQCLRLLPSRICKPFFIAKITKLLSTDADDSFAIMQKNSAKKKC